MPRLEISKERCRDGSLPRICVLTGSTKDVAFVEVTLLPQLDANIRAVAPMALLIPILVVRAFVPAIPELVVAALLVGTFLVGFVRIVQDARRLSTNVALPFAKGVREVRHQRLQRFMGVLVGAGAVAGVTILVNGHELPGDPFVPLALFLTVIALVMACGVVLFPKIGDAPRILDLDGDVLVLDVPSLHAAEAWRALLAAPAPVLPGARCGAHEAGATFVCGRCASFACERCPGTLDDRLCGACHDRLEGR